MAFIEDQLEYVHIKCYLCVNSSTVLNFSQFKEKIPGIDALFILYDSD